MATLHHPLVPTGILLVVLGLGNWYVGIDKGAEYQQLLRANDFSPPVQLADDFDQLSARTTATVLRPLVRGSDRRSLVETKADFYTVLQSGGRLLVLLGLFCTAAGFIHALYPKRAPNAP